MPAGVSPVFEAMSEKLSRITHKKAERVPGEDPVAAPSAAPAKRLTFWEYMHASPKTRSLAMLVLYIGTGTLGGLAFSAIELPVEMAAAAAARDQVRELRDHRAKLSAALENGLLDNDIDAKNSLDALMGAVSVEGIGIDDDLEEPAHHNWEFESSFFFCVTIMTTIGYGSFAPATAAGRLLVIPFGMIGICITGVVLSLLAVDIDIAITWLVKTVCRTTDADAHRKRYAILVVVALYWVGTALFYKIEEGWSMVDSLYAIFVTYTTIGFGDFVPEPDLEYVWSIEVLVGLALFAALIQAETDAVEEAEHDAQERALKDAAAAGVPEGLKGTKRAELL